MAKPDSFYLLFKWLLFFRKKLFHQDFGLTVIELLDKEEKQIILAFFFFHFISLVKM